MRRSEVRGILADRTKCPEPRSASPVVGPVHDSGSIAISARQVAACVFQLTPGGRAEAAVDIFGPLPCRTDRPPALVAMTDLPADHPAPRAAAKRTAEVTDASGGDPKADRIDERLLVASRGGDREAFRQLIERHREDLLRFLVRFLGSRTAADDVFQDTFLQVHLAADTFDAERRFRPWLYAIAANKARDFHRRSKRRAATSLSTPIGPAGEGGADLIDLMVAPAESPDKPTETSEIQQRVKRVVDEMPAHYREILLLAYFQKMSYHQIAECLGIPLGTVKSRLHAAVAHFAGTWKAAYPEREADDDPS